jgi:uncharacterized protein YxeA
MKNLILTLVLVLSVMVTQAQNTNQQRSSDRQQTTVKQENVPSKVLNTFKQNFPSATNTKWSKYRNYYEASFTRDGKNYQVSITPNGEWIQTAVTGSMNELPPEVKEQFRSGEYASHEVRNIREVSSTGNERIFMVEVVSTEADREEPVYLYYEPSGNLYRVGSNPFVMGSPVVRHIEAREVSRDELPANAENAFMETHPEVKSVRWKLDKNRYIGEYSDKGRRMYFITSPEGEWQETAAEYNFQQLPQPVRDAYNKAQYKDWEVYNAEFIRPAFAEDESNVKFRIHMYKLNPDNNYTYKTLTYDPQGNLLHVDQ